MTKGTQALKSDTLVEVDHLYRDYGPVRAVEDVSFQLRKGDILGFLGPNGAGKTTTMQIIAGNLAPTNGQVTINGVDLLDEPKRAKGYIGYLPEAPPLYRELKVDEYLRYCARINRIPRSRVREAVEEAKERCGIAGIGGRLIGNLSKGYQQRVGIAQAIIHKPEVVILDEPTIGLDPIQIREIRTLIRELAQSHGAIVSTHILPEVQAVCNRVQIIHRGRLVFTDTLEHLNERMAPTSLRITLGNPPSPSAIESIEGVSSLEPLGDGEFRLRHEPGSGLAEALAERAVTEGWKLRALVPEQVSLEQIFVDLTLKEGEKASQKSHQEEAA